MAAKKRRQSYTSHQKRVIRNYYRNRDAIDTQRLQELVTELYLATTPTKQARLWERVQDILERAPEADAEMARRVVAEQDLEALARLATERFQAE